MWKQVPAGGRYWFRFFPLMTVVTLGFSQIFYSLVVANQYAFPRSRMFLLWSLFWLQVLPVLILALVDFLLHKRSSQAHRLWTAFLTVLLMASLLRQFQVFHHQLLLTILGNLVPVWLLYVVVLALTGFLAIGREPLVSLFLTYVGVLSIAAPMVFFYQARALWWNAPATPPFHVAAQPVIPHHPVFLIVFDELSYDVLAKDGKLDRKSFPNFASLADDGVWFSDVTTSHWNTYDAIPSILTGKVIPKRDTPTLFQRMPEEYQTIMITTEMELETWFASAGYSGIDATAGKMRQLSVSPWLTLRYLAGRIERFFFASSPASIIFDDPSYHVSLDAELQSLLDAVDSGYRFLFWHCSVPHSPFVFTEDGKPIRRPPTLFPFADEYDPFEFPSIWERYRRQVKYADHLLGRILQKLKQLDIYDQSIVVVTSDHGVRVWGNIFRHALLTARVPLLIHAPGLKPGINPYPAQSIDIAPTILELANLPVDSAEFDGQSLIHGRTGNRSRIMYFFPRNVAFDIDSDSMYFIPQEMALNLTRRDAMQKQRPHQFSLWNNAQMPLLQTTFSATMVIEDLWVSRNQGRDFLKVYLLKDFPLRINPGEITSLQEDLRLAGMEQETPSSCFRRGMLHFFLALADTVQVYRGQGRNIDAINDHWKQSIYWLKKTGDLQPWAGEEIEKVVKLSDRDGNKFLDESELVNMIRVRVE